MKPAAIIGVAAVAAIGVGASTFLLVRGGGHPAGAASREELVARTVDGINAGDRDALLAILVGPASDRLAADCDDEGVKTSEAHEAARVQRVQDDIDNTSRRQLVVDHLGDDRSEVQLGKGEAIDKHCTARAAIVRHETTVALHDTKDGKFVAKLVAMEISGRWFLAQVPIAKPAKAKRPLYSDQGYHHGELSPVCEQWWSAFQQVLDCDVPAGVRSEWFLLQNDISNRRLAGTRVGPHDDDCVADRLKLVEKYPGCIE